MDRLIGSRLAVRVHRLKHPVYRNKALQVVADAVLVGFAYYLAFRLRFLESAGGLPEPYSDMLWGSIGFVVAGTVLFACVARGFGSRRPARDLAIALILTLGVYLFFVKLLNVGLPAGWLAPVLGGAGI